MATGQRKETPFSKKLRELSEKHYHYMALADQADNEGNLKKSEHYRKLKQKWFDRKYAHVDTLFTQSFLSGRESR
jgi:hypothetical protein